MSIAGEVFGGSSGKYQKRRGRTGRTVCLTAVTERSCDRVSVGEGLAPPAVSRLFRPKQSTGLFRRAGEIKTITCLGGKTLVFPPFPPLAPLEAKYNALEKYRRDKEVISDGSFASAEATRAPPLTCEGVAPSTASKRRCSDFMGDTGRVRRTAKREGLTPPVTDYLWYAGTLFFCLNFSRRWSAISAMNSEFVGFPRVVCTV